MIAKYFSMKKKQFFFLLVCAILPVKVTGQDTVHYLMREPVIDGYADVMLPDFRLHPFSVILKSDEKNPDIKAGYYLAYSEKYLYLYIEANTDSITIRDRGYQNGDGFHLLIGKPQKNNAPTDEFYVLAFSAENSWCHKMIWYYNVDLKMSRLSNDTKFEITGKNGKISFELLLPWKDVYPYHPWFSESVGINLCFVKAIHAIEKNYYFLKEDEKLQSEQSKKKYDVLCFERPHQSIPQFSSMLLKNNMNENDTLLVEVAGFQNTDTTRNITISVVSGENSMVTHKDIELKFASGLSENEIPVESTDLIPGGYKVKVFCEKALIGEHYLTIFPNANTQDLKTSLRSLDSAISAGTCNTLMFYINDIDSSLNKLKKYECSFVIRSKIAEVENYLSELRKGNDLISRKKGFYRRAYMGIKDNTLYPYSIYVPEDYSEDKKFPLLVYLHGSGDDDRVLSETKVIPYEGFIILAPGGHGTSNCFAGIEPQTDIEESISDVIKNFNIDTSKIILSGFSMGGYGVYRTYYEHPGRYKAIAIVSGHPDLARKWGESNEFNFLEDKNLKKFKKIPVYIFHGTSDLNCPFNLTEQLVNKLKKNGCNVTFVTDKGGHGNMQPEVRNKYFDWLKRQAD
jgi:predicted esterase